MTEAFGLNFTVPGGSGTHTDPSRFARLSDIQRGMRSHLPNPFTATSSMYSQGTNPNLSTVNGPSITPRSTGLFGRREQTRSHPSPNASTAHLPMHSQPMPMSYSPLPPPSGWNNIGTNNIPQPTPAVLPDSRPVNERSNTSGTETSLESTSSTAAQERRRRKQRRNHRHHRQRGWVRSHRSGTPPASRRRHFLHDAPKGDNSALSVFVAAIFLAATLATYLAIALAVKGLGQELHILFSLTLAGGAIFLVYSLFRFHRARKQRQRREQRRQQRQVVKQNDRSNFTPVVPIRVHMVQDEEIAEQDEDSTSSEEKVSAVKVPPPAYGLWRSSVKVNPELLYWHRVNAPPKPNMHESHGISNIASQEYQSARIERQGPRPPSYISDDGVSYVVTAQPRSTVFLERPPDQNHPAYHY